MSLSWNSAGTWLLHCAAGGGLILLLTCLLLRHTRQPARRQRLGELGVAAALLLAAVSLRPPWLIVGYSSPAPAPSPPPGPAVEDLVVDWRGELALPVPAADRVEGEAIGPALAVPPPPPAAPPQGDEQAAAWWQTALAAVLPWVVALYALSAAFLLGRWLLGHAALARLLRRAGPAPAEVAQVFAAMAPGKRRPRLLVSRRLHVPLSCGLLRPTVVLPAALCAPPDLQKLRWVFAHELTHLERRDAWSALLFALGEAVYFFLPWFGWLRRQVRLCQEYIADAAAAGQDEPAVDYAEFLLSLTGAPAVPGAMGIAPPPPRKQRAAGGVSGNCSDLYRRVSMLLEEPLRVEKRCPRRWSLAAAGGLLSLAVVVGGIGIGVRAEASPPVVIIIPGGKEAPKEAKPEQAKGARVLVVPGPGGEKRGVFLFKKVDEGAPVKEGERIVVIKKLVDGKEVAVAEKLLGGKVLREALRLEKIDLDGLHHLLKKLEGQPGQADIQDARKRVQIFLEQIGPGVAGKRVVQPQDIEIEIDGKRVQKKVDAGKVIQPALDALRRALQALEKQEGLPEVRNQLKAAIQQLEGGKLLPNIELRFAPDGKHLPLQWKVQPDGVLKLWQVPAGQLGPDGAFKFWSVKPLPGAVAWRVLPGQPIDAEAMKKLRDDVRKRPDAAELLKALDAFEEALKIAPANKLWQYEPARALIVRHGSAPARLGIEVERLTGALADQLNLPKGRGLLVTSVKADSPAAKAGLKVNDVLLKLGKQEVPGDAAQLAGLLEKLPGQPVDAVVLRKGKEETVKGIAVPARTDANFLAPQSRDFKAAPGAGQDGVMTTMFRTGDRFTTRYQEGSLVITLTGTFADGKAKLGQVHVQDGQVANTYDSVERVPAQYRDKVMHLLDVTGRGQFRMERRGS